MSEHSLHQEPPDDPEAPRYDTIEEHVVTREERQRENARGRGLLRVLAIAFLPVLALLTFGAYLIGNHQEAQFAQAAQIDNSHYTLLYLDPHHQFSIVVRRVNPGLHQEADFLITVVVRVPGHPGQYVVYQFLASGDPPADGTSFIMHCKIGKKFVPLCAGLVLNRPLDGQVFTSGGKLSLAVGRYGTFTMTPASEDQAAMAETLVEHP